jgi:hypothetical protein
MGNVWAAWWTRIRFTSSRSRARHVPPENRFIEEFGVIPEFNPRPANGRGSKRLRILDGAQIHVKGKPREELIRAIYWLWPIRTKPRRCGSPCWPHRVRRQCAPVALGQTKPCWAYLLGGFDLTPRGTLGQLRRDRREYPPGIGILFAPGYPSLAMRGQREFLVKVDDSSADK